MFPLRNTGFSVPSREICGAIALQGTLRRWAHGQRLPVICAAEVNRYDPPFKPWFLRSNEVWLPLAADVQNDRP